MPLTQVQSGMMDSTAQYYGFKNRIINGAMVIDQRNAGASVSLTSSAQYTVDRWFATENTDGTMTAQRSTVAPTGFINSLLFTTGTADASLSASQFAAVQQRIEGLNVADFGWGSAAAVTITLSFWVRSSLTGTFGGSLRNNAGNRSYAFSYSISAADTWEYKTVSIAGDTSGTWLTDNSSGIGLTFGLGVGSDFSGTADSWTAANYLAPTGATSVIGTAGATFYITGVQLEKGSTATSFDYRPYGTELQLCQRYYYKTYDQSVSPGSVSGNGVIAATSTANVVGGVITTAQFPVNMRAAPTVTYYSSATGASGVWRASSGVDAGVATYLAAGERGVQIYNTVASGAASAGLYGHVVAAIEL